MHQTAWSAYSAIVHDPAVADALAPRLADASSILIRDRVMRVNATPFEDFGQWPASLHSASALLATPGVLPALLASLVVFVIVDACTQFLPVFALRRASAFGACTRSVRMGIAHLGRIVVHMWLLRLLLWTGLSVLVILPAALIRYAAGPALAQALGERFSQISQTSMNAGLACAQVAAGVFVAVYTARLCHRLEITPAAKRGHK
jgi:hypothetical protein